MKKIINEIINSINDSINNTSTSSTMIVFSDSKYNSVNIDKTYFHEIKETIPENNIARIAFIDGGNTSIIESPNLSVQFIRLFAGLYKSNKKIKSIKHEFFILSQIQNKKIASRIFPIDSNLKIEDQDLEFDLLDKTLREGNEPAKVSTIANCARRFGEILLAVKIADVLQKNDIIILDGDLQPRITNEQKHLDVLFKKAEKKQIKIGALAKTCRLITDSGDSAINAISKIAEIPVWYYYPIAETESAVNLFFCKLHKLSKYVFKFDLLMPSDKLYEVFAVLAANSKDPVFLGYPYGLVDADQNARVPNSEKEYLRTIFSSKIDISSYENGLDAHSILDSIR
jgi:hypothetical protein